MGYQRIDAFNDFQYSIHEFKKSEFGKAIPRDEKEFEKLLYYGSFILKNFKDQMKNRLYVSLSLIVTGSILIPVNFYDYMYSHGNRLAHPRRRAVR